MQYRNPDHPCGALYPQPIGALRGGRSKGQKQRDLLASQGPDAMDPTFAATWQAEREAAIEALVSMDSEVIA